MEVGRDILFSSTSFLKWYRRIVSSEIGDVGVARYLADDGDVL